MYIARNRAELYIQMAVYIGYLPDFTTYRYFSSQEDAETELYQAIDNVFSAKPEVHARMKDAAGAAFLACREGRTRDASDCFGIIIDELS
jgi:hypothetical protein